ncbi:uncharacterized protein LOC120775315 [Bactrocera tryoni]|uniref:uncharacterized protein LOC120775315 n=1 Tax=Bactrocera tryoni TaxID=59916 RepID=UPI001A986E35|nr:uncharacterized protein LOC120775315 [Bactrocera tryoni]
MPKVMGSIDAEGNVTAGSHSGREARNLAEKQRRDKVNASIRELANIVPQAADSSRRLDRTGILRCAAHGFRLQYIFGKSVPRKQTMTELSQDPNFADALTYLLDSFFITLTCHGQIVVVSNSVEKLLGHCQSDLYGQNILSITHPDDHPNMLQQLIPRDMEALFRCSHEYQMQQQNNDSNSNENTDTFLKDINERLRNDKRSFVVRLARAGTRSEANRKYELVRIDGCFRRSDYSCSNGTFPIVSHVLRRTRYNGTEGVHAMQHDVIAQAALHGISGNDVVLVAMARIIHTPKITHYLTSENSGRMEYRTRHLIDGRIIDCDQRIGLVAGYMRDEVYNLSPFSFIHHDDVRWVIVALRQMYDNFDEQGESYYRLLARNGTFIYLHSQGYYDTVDTERNVYSFVCINTLLDEEEGRYYMEDMKRRFSTIIHSNLPISSTVDAPASHDPVRLERSVMFLIDNLQTRRTQGNGTGCGEDTATQADNERTKSRRLMLVPPEVSSVRSSIMQSLSVVNIAAKNLRRNIRRKARRDLRRAQRGPQSCSDSSDTSISIDSSDEDVANDQNTASSDSMYIDATQANLMRPSVLQMNTGASTSQRSALEQRLTASTNGEFDVNNATHTPALKRARATVMAASCSSGNCSGGKKKSTKIYIEEIIHQPKTCMSTLLTPPATTMPIASTTEIHEVINNSLENIDQSLQSIQANARNLCQQHAQFLPLNVPQNFNQQLDEIIVEHQRQAEQLINIRNEYDVHLQQQLTPHQPPELQQTQLPAFDDLAAIDLPLLPQLVFPGDEQPPHIDAVPNASNYIEASATILSELEKRL